MFYFDQVSSFSAQLVSSLILPEKKEPLSKFYEYILCFLLSVFLFLIFPPKKIDVGNEWKFPTITFQITFRSIAEKNHTLLNSLSRKAIYNKDNRKRKKNNRERKYLTLTQHIERDVCNDRSGHVIVCFTRINFSVLLLRRHHHQLGPAGRIGLKEGK